MASILTGCDTPDHVKEAAGYETATEEEKDYATVLAKAPHHAYSGQCTYCGHCAPCPAQIDIAMVNKLYDLAVMLKEIPPVSGLTMKDYLPMQRTASDAAAVKRSSIWGTCG